MDDRTEGRPDPDRLLAQIRQTHRNNDRGRLKIFFGYAAGVGKTYTMLEDAHGAKKAGIDVVVGYIEPHTRPETLALLDGLEALPEKQIEYKGISLKDFDLDGALKRRPQLILVDELAHTNAEGLRHRKRYSDIEELLDAGIDVYTTVNVQHIESLNDIVASFTEVIVQERVPDYIFNRADQVELIDLEPGELIQRLNEGKIYKKGQAQRALSNFFTNENLVALREISLRYTADRVNKELEGKKNGGATHRRKVNEHILVCLSSASGNANVIRTAARMAKAFHANFSAIYVETPKTHSFSESRKKNLHNNMKLAEELGAKITTTYSDDIPYQIAEFARVSGISKIVAGRSKSKRYWRRRNANFIDRLNDLAPELEIFIIPTEMRGDVDGKLFERKVKISVKDILVTLASVCVATLIGLLVHRVGLMDANVVIIYLLAVLVVANHTEGRLYGVLSSVISVFAFNYFFTEPKLTFEAYNGEYPITFAIMLAAAFITSTLTSRARTQTRASALNVYRTNILLEMNNTLQNAETLEDIVIEAEREIYKVVKKPLVFYTAEEGKISNYYSYQSDEEVSVAEQYFDMDEQAVAAWVLKNKKRAGIGTDTLPGAKACYLPIIAHNKAVAVVAIVLMPGEQIEEYEKSLLAAMLGQIAFAIEKYDLSEAKNNVAMQAETERMHANLLRAVSHDLRTPLTSISGSASTLLESKLDEATQKKLVKGIFDDSIWLSKLVENLLSVSRMDRGGVNLKKEPQLVEEIVTAAISHVEQSIGEHTINTNIQNPLLMVNVDATLIVQVFVNLIDNTFKYTQSNSTVTITALQRGKEVMIQIADNGPGIKDEDKDTIFDRFFTVDNRSGDSRRGLGLGLAICKSIVEAHGGEIYAKDNKPVGMIFGFLLPLAEVKQNENFDSNRRG